MWGNILYKKKRANTELQKDTGKHRCVYPRPKSKELCQATITIRE